MLRLLTFLLILSPPAQADVIWVTDLTDDTNTNNGTCNLREAIMAADDDVAVDACPAGNGTDDIYFAQTGTIALIDVLPTLTQSVNIIGPGAHLLKLDGNGVAVGIMAVDGDPGDEFMLCGVTLTGGGPVQSGGALHVGASSTLLVSDAIFTDNDAQNGGAIYARGELTLEQVTVWNNNAVLNGGGIYALTGSLTIRNSTISGNTTNLTSGGGIFSQGNLTILRSTISGNTANEFGGGININHTSSGQTISIQHSTITDNTAGAGTTIGNAGGLMYTASNPSYFDLSLKNTIVAGNTDLAGTGTSNAPDLWLQTITGPPSVSAGYNLIGDNNGAAPYFPAGNPNANNDYVGTSLTPLIAHLDPLADNGGPTHTHAPTQTATEIRDQGSCAGEDYDQRGYAGDRNAPSRPRDLPETDADDGCDIGALEVSASRVASKVSTQVFLDGPYDANEQIMNDDLLQAGLLPLLQPYEPAPWGYGGIEEMNSLCCGLVDWILISLYQGGPQDAGGLTEVVTRAFLIYDDGTLRIPDIADPIRIDPGPYYIGVTHRNHLDVLSNGPIHFKWNTTTWHDFTSNLEGVYSNGGLALRDRGSGLFTMWGGDGDANGQASAFDFLNVWLPINGGSPGYTGGDFNMDGSPTAFDFLNVWLPANGQASQVP